MKHLLLRNKHKRAAAAAALVYLFMIMFSNLSHGKILAAEVSNRSIRIGTSLPGKTTTHRLQFNLSTAGNVGSIKFEYCTNSSLVNAPCTAPAGLNLTGATLTGQIGQTGFSKDASSTVNKLVLTRPVAPAAPGTVIYTFSNAVNPTGFGSVFVRISTYATTNATGAFTDYGTVVFAIIKGLGVNTFVPPFLIFCVAVTINTNCSNTSGSVRDMGTFTSASPSFTTSQFAGATNDFNGYSVHVAGTTMTSGNNTITPLSSQQGSNPGTRQFGFNLKANSNPAQGAEVTGVGTAVAQAGYNAADNYRFISGDLVASSPLSTDYNVFTVSYIVNIDNTQPLGFYSTTLTYIATAAF